MRNINEDCAARNQKLNKERCTWMRRVSVAQDKFRTSMDRLKSVTHEFNISQELNASSPFKDLSRTYT